MKAVITADTHFDYANRLGDFSRSFTNIIQYAIDNKAQYFIIAGDLYRSWKADPRERRVLYYGLSLLISSGIQAIIVLGNHDVYEYDNQGSYNSITGIGYFSIGGLKIVEMPGYSISVDDTYICFIPHLNKDIIVSRNYNDIFKNVLELSRPPPTSNFKNKILISHAFIDGSKLGSSDVSVTSERSLDLDMLKKSWPNMMFFGDIHKHQVLSENPLIVYPGSIDKITFGEMLDPKGFIWMDTDSDPKYKFVEIPTRRFIEIILDINTKHLIVRGFNIDKDVDVDMSTENISDLMDCFKVQISDAIVKISIIGKKQNLDLLSRDALVNRVRDMKPKVLKYFRFVSTDDVIARDKSFVDDLDPGVALDKWVKFQKYTEDKKKLVYDAGLNMLSKQNET